MTITAPAPAPQIDTAEALCDGTRQFHYAPADEVTTAACGAVLCDPCWQNHLTGCTPCSLDAAATLDRE